MKTIYSLREFHNLVKERAAKAGETYAQVEVKLCHSGEFIFKAYVHDYGWNEGNTMEAALQALDKAMGFDLKLNGEIDVEVDVENPNEETAILTEK